MSAIETFGAFVAGGRPRELAAECRDPLFLHFADTIGAWIAGARTREGAAIFRLRDQLLADGGDELALDIMARCAVTRLSEVDDIHLAAMITAGSIVIPAAMSIAPRLEQLDPAEFRAAIICGYEAMTRLGLSIDGPTILYRGIWPTYFAAPFGVAAVASRLFGFDATQTAHALALSLTWAAPGVSRHNAATGARWLSAGHAARNGVDAALAARASFTSELTLFESGFFQSVYNITPNIAALSDGLGTHAMLSDVSFKPWCAARQTMAAVQGLKEILTDGVAAETIEQIEAHVLPPHLRMIDHGVERGDRASHLTSLPYQLALAALSPAEMLDIEQSPETVPDAIKAFIAKVKVTPDGSLLADYPRTWPARVVVTTRSSRHERTVTHVAGDPVRAFTESDVVNKFRKLASASENADKLFELCRNVIEGSKSPEALVQAIRVG